MKKVAIIILLLLASSAVMGSYSTTIRNPKMPDLVFETEVSSPTLVLSNPHSRSVQVIEYVFDDDGLFVPHMQISVKSSAGVFFSNQYTRGPNHYWNPGMHEMEIVFGPKRLPYRKIRSGESHIHDIDLREISKGLVTKNASESCYYRLRTWMNARENNRSSGVVDAESDWTEISCDQLTVEANE